jgi:hypothetical protein
MAIKDLGAFLDDDGLDIPIGGKTYRVSSPDGETGLRLAALANLSVSVADETQVSERDRDRLRLSDQEEHDFLRDVLGSTLDELLADGVSWVRIQRLGRYCFLYFTLGEDVADDAANSVGEAPAPNRAQRRAASRGGANKTQKQGSTAGTTSPRKRTPAPEAEKAAG